MPTNSSTLGAIRCCIRLHTNRINDLIHSAPSLVPCVCMVSAIACHGIAHGAPIAGQFESDEGPPGGNRGR